MVESAVASRLSLPGSNSTTSERENSSTSYSPLSSSPPTVAPHPIPGPGRPVSPRALTHAPRTRFNDPAKSAYIVSSIATDRHITEQIDQIVQSSIDKHMEVLRQVKITVNTCLLALNQRYPSGNRHEDRGHSKAEPDDGRDVEWHRSTPSLRSRN